MEGMLDEYIRHRMSGHVRLSRAVQSVVIGMYARLFTS
jgi:hypothetical protein